MWGTDYNWTIAASHFGIEEPNPRLALVKHLDKNPEQRPYGEVILRENGIWEQALQIAKENDLQIIKT